VPSSIPQTSCRRISTLKGERGAKGGSADAFRNYRSDPLPEFRVMVVDALTRHPRSSDSIKQLIHQ